jgi:hypothetical protein
MLDTLTVPTHLKQAFFSELRQDGRPPYTWLHFYGTNFDSWQFDIKLAIQSEELWGIVSPTEPKPQLLAVV